MSQATNRLKWCAFRSKSAVANLSLSSPVSILRASPSSILDQGPWFAKSPVVHNVATTSKKVVNSWNLIAMFELNIPGKKDILIFHQPCNYLTLLHQPGHRETQASEWPSWPYWSHRCLVIMWWYHPSQHPSQLWPNFPETNLEGTIMDNHQDLFHLSTPLQRWTLRPWWAHELPSCSQNLGAQHRPPLLGTRIPWSIPTFSPPPGSSRPRLRSRSCTSTAATISTAAISRKVQDHMTQQGVDQIAPPLLIVFCCWLLLVTARQCERAPLVTKPY